MKNQLTDEKLKEKFTDDDKKVIEEASAEGLQFVSSASEASKEDFEKKQKELEAKFNPIMMRVYQEAGGAPGGMPGGMPGAGGMPGGAPGGAPQADVDDLD
jgi:L1 cell adhesion molecule like protein